MNHSEKHSRWIWTFALLLIAVYAGQAWTSMLDKSATYDEQVYVLAGMGLIETGEYALKQDSPPLIPLLSASAVKIYELFGNEITLSEEIQSQFDEVKELWSARSLESSKEYSLATKFFHENNGPTLIQVARAPIILLGAMLAFYLFRFATILFGPKIALCVLFLYAMDPNLIGHARVVSADLGLACFFLVSHYYLYRCLTETGSFNSIALSVAVTLCISVKLSGLLVLPSLLILAVFVIARPPEDVIESLVIDSGNYRIQIARQAFISVASLVVLLYVGLALMYQNWKAPILYYQATQLIYSNVPEEYTSYLMGEFRPKFWYYYFVALVLKTPISTIGLFATSLLFFRSRYRLVYWFVIIPLTVIMVVTTLDGINIGLRRVLLALPLIHLAIGGLFAFVWCQETSSVKTTFGKVVAVVGLLWTLFIGVQTFPHHLSFFSTLIGGPSQGHQYLAESNVSWGQNLPALSRYLKAEGIDGIYMHLYGNDEPSDYGIQNKGFDDYHVYWPIQDVYVVSAHSLIQFSKNEDPGANWFKRFDPLAIINHTLYVFDLRGYPSMDLRTPDRSLEIAENFIAKKEWGSAIPHLQHYLVHFPNDSDVHKRLADVANKLGHKDLFDFHQKLAAKE